MKCFIVALLVFAGCSYETPILTDNSRPFLVYKITRHNDSLSAYYSHGGGVHTFPGLFLEKSNTVIILPSGMFDVGDTVRVVRANTSKARGTAEAKDGNL